MTSRGGGGDATTRQGATQKSARRANVGGEERTSRASLGVAREVIQEDVSGKAASFASQPKPCTPCMARYAQACGAGRRLLY